MKQVKNQNVQKSLHWSNYWKGGQLTSLPQDFKENYEGNIQNEWNISFSKLKDSNKILDLCAGNCAISLLAVEYKNSNKLDIEVNALDAADINKKNILKKFPNKKNQLDEIKIYSNTRVENTKLESNHFDLITSQYGIEYCDWELAAKEVNRLLKPQGEFVLISHSGSTEIVKYMNIEKNDYQALFDSLLFKYLSRYSHNKISYRDLMSRLKKIQPKIVSRYKENPTQLLESILIVLDNIYAMPKSKMKANQNELDLLCKQHRFAFERMNDLLRVIKLMLENPNWYDVFIRNGLELIEKKDIVHNSSVNSGQLFRFQKIK
ncbi:MAG: class I SAM-dependent methyltransferase [Marinicellaceae bacterium]